MNYRIQTNLGKLPDPSLINRADYIINNMTGNPSYPAPMPAIADVQTALDKFNLDVVAASGRDKVLVAEKNKSRQILLVLLRSLGLNLMATTPDDAAALASSGFPMAKTPEPGYLTNPEGISIRNGQISGQVVCRVKPVKYADLYTYEVTSTAPTPDASWTSTRSSKSFHTFPDLQPGTKYWFRVGAIRGDALAYSQIASVYVQ